MKKYISWALFYCIIDYAFWIFVYMLDQGKLGWVSYLCQVVGLSFAGYRLGNYVKKVSSES